MKIFLLLFINFYLLNTYAAVKNDSQAFYNDIQMIESKSLDLINEIENLNSAKTSVIVQGLLNTGLKLSWRQNVY